LGRGKKIRSRVLRRPIVGHSTRATNHFLKGLTMRNVRCLTACFILLAGAGSATARILHVGGKGGTYQSIQAALDAANPYDEIEVAPGTYSEHTIDFKGKAVRLYSRDGAAATTIAGDYRVVVACVSNETYDTILEGFTITRGMSWMYFGWGMYNRDSSPTVINCTFSLVGVAMWNEGSNPTVAKCTFSENSVGIWNDDSSPTVANCTFVDNRPFEPGTSGGGMANYNSSPTVINCQFINNHATVYGGAVYNEDGDPTIVNCTFIGNSVMHFGGGMYNYGGNPTLTNCTFTDNMDYDPWGGGGGIANYGGSLTLTNCILWSDFGGEIYGDATVIYSDVQGGFAGEGNIDADPRLDATGHLQIGSPCINAGSSPDVPDGVVKDLDGSRRIQGTSVDMGAYESSYRAKKIKP
jgi:parallel beta-helix repeat protein/predicted outer membrane repeat protein